MGLPQSVCPVVCAAEAMCSASAAHTTGSLCACAAMHHHHNMHTVCAPVGQQPPQTVEARASMQARRKRAAVQVGSDRRGGRLHQARTAGLPLGL